MRVHKVGSWCLVLVLGCSAETASLDGGGAASDGAPIVDAAPAADAALRPDAGTAPLDAGQESCGDGVVQETEQCDGAAVPASCASLGYFSGTLACQATCVFDETDCSPMSLAPADRQVSLSRFSPNGDRLFWFEREAEEQPWWLVARHVASGVVTRIAEVGTFVSQTVVSPDGTKVLYLDGAGGEGIACAAHLFDFGTGRSHAVVTDAPCSGFPAVFSADSAYVVVMHAVVATAALTVFDTTSSTSVLVTHALPSPGRPGWSLSPDGRRLVYFDDGNGNVGTPGGTLRSRDLVTGATVELDVDVYQDHRGFRFSPDGRRVAYFRGCVDYVCALVDRDLGGVAPAVEIAARVNLASLLSPTWTSAVVVRNEQGVTVSLLDRGSSTLHALPETYADSRVSDFLFSADGSQLVYTGRRAGTNEAGRLFHVDVRTGTATPIARHIPGLSIERPRFTADGAAVLFGRFRSPDVSSRSPRAVYLATARGVTATVAADVVSMDFVGAGEHVVTGSDEGALRVFDRVTETTVVEAGPRARLVDAGHPRWLAYVTPEALFLYDLPRGPAPRAYGTMPPHEFVSSETHFAFGDGWRAFLSAYPIR